MGDFFQTVVDVEATPEEAGELAARIVDVLVRRGVLARELTSDGVYSFGADVGHLPGPGWASAVSDPSWEPGPVAVLVGRGWFCGGQGSSEAEAATCPRCGDETRFVDFENMVFETDEEAWAPFARGIEAWRTTGRGSVGCPACGVEVPVTAWSWGTGFALGCLALDFWNWPELRPDFVADLRRELAHDVDVVSGKF